MKFEKKSGQVLWSAQFNELTSIGAITSVPNDSFFYGCGEKEETLSTGDKTTSAGVFKMDENGAIEW